MNKLFDLLSLHVINLAISAAGAVRYNRKDGEDYRNHLSFLLNSNIAEKDEADAFGDSVGKVALLNLHAGVAAKP